MKRALLQFTPSSWKKIDWFAKENPLTRFLALGFLMIMWQIAGTVFIMELYYHEKSMKTAEQS